MEISFFEDTAANAIKNLPTARQVFQMIFQSLL